MKTFFKIFIGFLLVVVSSNAAATPIDGLGTVLPRFNPSSVPFRAFNDLMKQSLPLVPYQLSSYGSIGRCWSCTLNFIDGLTHQYPANLSRFVWAVA